MYACRAQQVVNEVHRNVDPMIMQLRELRTQIADLQLRLKEAGGSNYTNEYVRGLEKKVKELEWKCADQERVISQLRAELESAGIADPTLVGRSKDERGATGTEGGRERPGLVSATTYHRNNELLQLELQSANKEIVRLQKELLESEKKVSTGRQADADERVARLQKEVDAWRSMLRDCDAHMKKYDTFQWRWTTDIVFSTFEDKMNALTRQCQEIMMNQGAWVMDTLNRGEREQLRAAATIQKQHNEEVSALTSQYRDSLDKIRMENAAKDEERFKRQREVSSTSELRNQVARETYEMDKRRWAQENENMKLAYEEKIANMRAEYQEDLKRLRGSLTSNNNDRQRNTTSLQKLQESHEAYVKSITDDIERERKRRDNELAEVKKQLSTELARKEEQLASRDAQVRRSEEAASKLRRDNLKLQTEMRAQEKQLSGEIKDLLLKQENMIAVSGTIVNNYEKNPESLGRDMELLRSFINDQDYAAFRAKAKELAYRDPLVRRLSTTTTGARQSSTTGGDGTAHDVNEIRSAIESLRRARDVHQANAQRVKQDVYEQLSRSRGFVSEAEDPKARNDDKSMAADATGAV
ncbi:putative kinesin [Leptomonas seymouri]|uniref:Putative kinesin n=1 Tax=Leptomonas seymouri TaxID=5684 RepID=A0A0N0P2P7_LEPSE|nr:putative kinesin [Leptomonas seymouri]|eukprot:KPI82757.1 putative kinesin [Leptomonas seymouri]